MWIIVFLGGGNDEEGIVEMEIENISPSAPSLSIMEVESPIHGQVCNLFLNIECLLLIITLHQNFKDEAMTIEVVKTMLREEFNNIIKSDGLLTKMGKGSPESLAKLEEFSLEALYDYFSSGSGCPHLLHLLEFIVAPAARGATSVEQPEQRGRKGLASRRNSLTVILCMLAKSRSERASGFQKVNSLCLASKGARRASVELLNKQEICLGYLQTLRSLSDLASYTQEKLRNFCRSQNWRGAMIVFDNFNIPKRVAHQRIDSKNEFYSWVVGLIVPIYRMPPAGTISHKPIRERSGFDFKNVTPQKEDFVEVTKFFLREVALFLSSKTFFPAFESISQQDIENHWAEVESRTFEDYSRFGIPSDIADFEVPPLDKTSHAFPIGLIDKDENTDMDEIMKMFVYIS